MNFLNLLICEISNMAYLRLFLREVRTAPELSTFLANDRRLQDIEKCCKNKLNGVVLGNYPTYNICNYYVTIYTYKNPLPEVSGRD